MFAKSEEGEGKPVDKPIRESQESMDSLFLQVFGQRTSGRTMQDLEYFKKFPKMVQKWVEDAKAPPQAYKYDGTMDIDHFDDYRYEHEKLIDMMKQPDFDKVEDLILQEETGESLYTDEEEELRIAVERSAEFHEKKLRREAGSDGSDLDEAAERERELAMLPADVREEVEEEDRLSYSPPSPYSDDEDPLQILEREKIKKEFYGGLLPKLYEPRLEYSLDTPPSHMWSEGKAILDAFDAGEDVFGDRTTSFMMPLRPGDTGIQRLPDNSFTKRMVPPKHRIALPKDLLGKYKWGITREDIAKLGCSLKMKVILSFEFCNEADINQHRIRTAIEKWRRFPGDTGSSEVQVAVLTERAFYLARHLHRNPKDMSSKRGYRKLLGQRARLLKYVKRQNIRTYFQLRHHYNI
eukprot:TRINITY_DN2526_c0_g1_i1.p1 TRINITY_DN2526_c0_g1~~TRINITY_DN2526_c0_g1_i1.p1  ORF type:complete len:471 (+),score=134.88 TRINITY_DN2526_c0_g1_i1:191-1414(+)